MANTSLYDPTTLAKLLAQSKDSSVAPVDAEDPSTDLTQLAPTSGTPDDYISTLRGLLNQSKTSRMYSDFGANVGQVGDRLLASVGKIAPNTEMYQNQRAQAEQDVQSAQKQLDAGQQMAIKATNVQPMGAVVEGGDRNGAVLYKNGLGQTMYVDPASGQMVPYVAKANEVPRFQAKEMSPEQQAQMAFMMGVTGKKEGREEVKAGSLPTDTRQTVEGGLDAIDLIKSAEDKVKQAGPGFWKRGALTTVAGVTPDVLLPKDVQQWEKTNQELRSTLNFNMLAQLKATFKGRITDNDIRIMQTMLPTPDDNQQAFNSKMSSLKQYISSKIDSALVAEEQSNPLSAPAIERERAQLANRLGGDLKSWGKVPAENKTPTTLLPKTKYTPEQLSKMNDDEIDAIYGAK